jgi:hypothetical protein
MLAWMLVGLYLLFIGAVAIVKPDWSAFDLAVYSTDESTNFTSINYS